jgi:hypothetical protein
VERKRNTCFENAAKEVMMLNMYEAIESSCQGVLQARKWNTGSGMSLTNENGVLKF